MQILKQIWSKEIEDTEVRNTYQYVLQLRERLESTLKIAQDSLGHGLLLTQVLVLQPNFLNY